MPGHTRWRSGHWPSEEDWGNSESRSWRDGAGNIVHEQVVYMRRLLSQKGSKGAQGYGGGKDQWHYQKGKGKGWSESQPQSQWQEPQDWDSRDSAWGPRDHGSMDNRRSGSSSRSRGSSLQGRSRSPSRRKQTQRRSRRSRSHRRRPQGKGGNKSKSGAGRNKELESEARKRQRDRDMREQREIEEACDRRRAAAQAKLAAKEQLDQEERQEREHQWHLDQERLENEERLHQAGCVEAAAAAEPAEAERLAAEQQQQQQWEASMSPSMNPQAMMMSALMMMQAAVQAGASASPMSPGLPPLGACPLSPGLTFPKFPSMSGMGCTAPPPMHSDHGSCPLSPNWPPAQKSEQSARRQNYGKAEPGIVQPAPKPRPAGPRPPAGPPPAAAWRAADMLYTGLRPSAAAALFAANQGVEAEAAPAEAPSIHESHEFGTGNEIGAWNMRQSRADAALVACRTIGCPFSAHRYRDFAGWCCKSCGQTEHAEERKDALICISSFAFNSEPFNGLLENWDAYSGRFHGCGCERLRYNGPPRPAGPPAAAEAAPVHEIL